MLITVKTPAGIEITMSDRLIMAVAQATDGESHKPILGQTVLLLSPPHNPRSVKGNVGEVLEWLEATLPLCRFKAPPDGIWLGINPHYVSYVSQAKAENGLDLVNTSLVVFDPPVPPVPVQASPAAVIEAVNNTLKGKDEKCSKLIH